MESQARERQQQQREVEQRQLQQQREQERAIQLQQRREQEVQEQQPSSPRAPGDTADAASAALTQKFAAGKSSSVLLQSTISVYKSVHKSPASVQTTTEASGLHKNQTCKKALHR
jgi:hypothetical protein